ncbi:hypothetical protein D3C84_1132480 [compost metagenome]
MPLMLFLEQMLLLMLVSGHEIKSRAHQLKITRFLYDAAFAHDEDQLSLLKRLDRNGPFF